MIPSQLTALLERTIPAKLPVLIKGSPGIGKTDVVKLASERSGARLVLKHPVVDDPVDYKGMPGIVDGKAKFLPFNDLTALIETDGLTVCFLDDLGQAAPAVQAACMQLILERRINGHKVSDDVVFIAATNRKRDKAGVSGILEPVKSRFATIVELEVDNDDWITWYLKTGLPAEVAAFIRFKPELLNDFKPTSDMTNSPCPRTVHSVAKLMTLGLPPELELESYTGAAGEAFAIEFMAFLKIFRQLPSMDSILLNPATAPVPDEPAALYSVASALATRASDKTMDSIVTYVDRIHPDFAVLTMKDAMRKDQGICHTRAFMRWAADNKEVFI